MSAGQIWQRADGLRWAEVQTGGVEPSGWRLMIPLLDLADAPDAPPLAVILDGWRARLHMISGVPQDELGEPDGASPPTSSRRYEALLEPSSPHSRTHRTSGRSGPLRADRAPVTGGHVADQLPARPS